MSRGKQTFISQSVEQQCTSGSLLPSITTDHQPSKGNTGCTHTECPPVPLLTTLTVKATHPVSGKEHSFPTAVPAHTSTGATFYPSGRWPAPSHPNRVLMHRWFRETVEVCLGGYQVTELRKNTCNLLNHYWCQLLGKSNQKQMGKI